MAGLHSAINTYDAYAVLPRHGHRGASLSLVLAGEQVERMGRRSWQCRPLSLLYKPPDIEHSNHVSGGGLRAIFIELSRETSVNLISERPHLADIRSVMVPSLSLLTHVNDGRRPIVDLAAAAAEELLYDLLQRLLQSDAVRPGRDREPWLRQVRDFVHVHFASPFSLAEAAAVGGVHPVHLAQTFRHVYGCTFGAYVRSVRLDAARMALADTRQSISTIALATGFADHAHFSRSFRARFGVSPREYRRSIA